MIRYCTVLTPKRQSFISLIEPPGLWYARCMFRLNLYLYLQQFFPLVIETFSSLNECQRRKHSFQNFEERSSFSRDLGRTSQTPMHCGLHWDFQYGGKTR